MSIVVAVHPSKRACRSGGLPLLHHHPGRPIPPQRSLAAALVAMNGRSEVGDYRVLELQEQIFLCTRHTPQVRDEHGLKVGRRSPPHLHPVTTRILVLSRQQSRTLRLPGANRAYVNLPLLLRFSNARNNFISLADVTRPSRESPFHAQLDFQIAYPCMLICCYLGQRREPPPSRLCATPVTIYSSFGRVPAT